MATQRIPTPSEQTGISRLGLLMLMIGLGVFMLGLLLISKLSVVTQPIYVYIFPASISAAGLYYMLQGIVYTLRR